MKPRTILLMVPVLVVLAVAYIFASRPEPEPKPEPVPYIWDVEMDELRHMTITLPDRDLSESWLVRDDKYWYFDEPDGPRVDMNRWGGGIPLLMTGPGADRVITLDASDQQLESYGLSRPRMSVELVLSDGREISIEVGDPTPTGGHYYVSPTGSRQVYSVDHTWYEVLERLVVEPPYPPGQS